MVSTLVVVGYPAGRSSLLFSYFLVPTWAATYYGIEVFMKEQSNRRKAKRVPVSFVVRCSKDEVYEEGVFKLKIDARAYNLSTGGIGVKTNYRFSVHDRIDVTFHLPDSFDTELSVSAEVAWMHFHADTPRQEESLLTGGIKFLNLQESSQVILNKYVQSVTD